MQNQYQEIEFDKLAKFLDDLGNLKFQGTEILDARGSNVPDGIFYTLGKKTALRLIEHKQKYFMISGDGRLDTPYVIQELTQAMTEQGITVICAGYNNITPLFEIERKQLGISGVNVTASHQNGSYIGIKLVIDSYQNSNDDFISGLKERVDRNKSQVIIGTSRLRRDYLKYLETRVGEVSHEGPILYDALEGVSFQFFSEIAKRKGIEYDSIRAEPSGFFDLTDNGPDPYKKENFDILKKCCDISKYSLILMVDGDGDRIGAATASGVIESPYLAALRAEFSDNPQFVAEHCLASIIKDYLSKRNISVISANRGRPNVIKACVENHALGAEMTLHHYNSDGVDDAVETAFELIKIDSKLESQGSSLERKVEEMKSDPLMRDFYSEIRVKTNGIPKSVITRLVKAYETDPLLKDYQKDSQGMPIDGIVIDNNDYGLFIRGSSNENSLTVNINWKKTFGQNKADEILGQVFEKLESIEPGLKVKLEKRLGDVKHGGN